MKSVVLLVAILFVFILGFSQVESNDKGCKMKFGFNLGVNYPNLQLKEASPSSAKISNGIGFRLGVLMDYTISKSLIFSPKSELSFNDCKVEFLNYYNSKTTYNIFPIDLEFMTHMVYRVGNSKMSPYFFTGPCFKIPLYKKTNLSSDFKTNPDFAIDFGIGLENKFKNFIFAPELRYSFGLLNINKNPNLQTLNFNNISLIFKFM